ncbi:ATP-binding cassette domain-containing protein [Kosmotoga pacifica]|uniref:ABC transporter ATP-binding protein n=1 Tax=Kosmotoga pacifica TaxID=1330330 RepID=A0A0G2ZBE5_9BACT|nr:ATP-binding cassette domain-containing protein [Kosmotoga pacifica]AKI97416.1 ABC transporter ATP-binding protein [Kosmotoga pacifica]
MSLLEARGIKKSFGAVEALKGVDFRVEEGEVVGLLGDNGAGKSTLIKIIAGYYHHDEGQIFFDGKEVKFNTPRDSHEAGIEVVYQDLALVGLMPVWRNFFLGREICKKVGPIKVLDKSKMRKVSRQGLRGLGIEIPSVDQAVAFLSGGQRQTVAVGRGVHFGAKLLILDEPTAAVSVRETEAILSLIEEVSKRGISVVLVAHNIYHVYRVASRFVVLDHGEKVADVSRDEVTAEDLIRIIAPPLD